VDKRKITLLTSQLPCENASKLLLETNGPYTQESKKKKKIQRKNPPAFSTPSCSTSRAPPFPIKPEYRAPIPDWTPKGQLQNFSQAD
jgi:hypothetical protein